MFFSHFFIYPTQGLLYGATYTVILNWFLWLPQWVILCDNLFLNKIMHQIWILNVVNILKNNSGKGQVVPAENNLCWKFSHVCLWVKSVKEMWPVVMSQGVVREQHSATRVCHQTHYTNRNRPPVGWNTALSGC